MRLQFTLTNCDSIADVRGLVREVCTEEHHKLRYKSSVFSLELGEAGKDIDAIDENGACDWSVDEDVGAVCIEAGLREQLGVGRC